MFKLLLFSAFLNGLLWILLIPVWQYPDEQSHFAQVQNTAERGYVPQNGPDTSLEISLSEKLLDTERDGNGNNKFTYHPYYHIKYTDSQTGHYESFINNFPKEYRLLSVKRESTHNPPLYHIMGSVFYSISSSGNLLARIYSVRFFSLFLYLALVIISFNGSKLIFNDKNQQLILTAIIAFAPMLVYATTGVLPDPLTILLFTITFTICIKIIKDNLTIPLLFLLIVIYSLGINTRQQFSVVLPIIFFSLMYNLIKKLPKFWKVGISITIFLTMIILINIIPVSIPEIGKPNLNTILSKEFINYLFATLKHYYSQTLPWYWGVYKWLSLTLPHFYYQIINRLILISLVGLAVWIMQILKTRRIQKTDSIITFLIFSIFTYFSVFIIWDFYFQKSSGYSFGIQGRYFLPLILPISTIIFFGLIKIFKLFFKKYTSLLCMLLAASIILFNDLSLSFVASTYYSADNLKNFILQTSQYKPEIFKGYIILFIIILSLASQFFFLLKLPSNVKKNYESF